MKKIIISLITCVICFIGNSKAQSQLKRIGSEEYKLINLAYSGENLYFKTLNNDFWTSFLNIRYFEKKGFCKVSDQIFKKFIEDRKFRNHEFSKTIKLKPSMLSNNINLKRSFRDDWLLITPPIIENDYAFLFEISQKKEVIKIFQKDNGNWVFVCSVELYENEKM